MITALLAARNILAGENKYDAWSVNEDGEYHESGGTGERPTDNLTRAIPRNASERGEVVG